ncbi:PIN domain-containing protein [Neisseriaceae bacterium B1]
MANEKIGIDTNLLVRYIVQDDETQAKIATSFLENLSSEKQGFICNLLMIELIWVLSQTYKQSRETIALVLDELWATDYFFFKNIELLHDVLAIYRQTRADFSDLLINKLN